ncbi:MAG: 3-deoxy-7-phosphoheptulonate synthase, partial [Ktedonobacteraceae bacterium]|nr:3-deoxy-7-phosphoheptulonate synthase [Ktedonobacteraceae bacterium]
MIVVMKASSSRENVQQVLAFLHKHGLSGHPSEGVERTVIGVLGGVGPSGTPGSIGGINPSIGESLEGMPGVESVLRVSKPYKLASREFHPEDTVVNVPVPCAASGSVGIGSSQVVMMAGPCTVESEHQLMMTAEAVHKEGAVI